MSNLGNPHLHSYGAQTQHTHTHVQSVCLPHLFGACTHSPVQYMKCGLLTELAYTHTRLRHAYSQCGLLPYFMHSPVHLHTVWQLTSSFVHRHSPLRLLAVLLPTSTTHLSSRTMKPWRRWGWGWQSLWGWVWRVVEFDKACKAGLAWGWVWQSLWGWVWRVVEFGKACKVGPNCSYYTQQRTQYTAGDFPAKNAVCAFLVGTIICTILAKLANTNDQQHRCRMWAFLAVTALSL
jgi:hypothetical protein